jgi:hypothetical protein
VSTLHYLSSRISAYLDFTVEAVGFIGRALSAGETPNWTLGPYLIQTLLLLLGPTLLAASIYMTLGRLIRILDANQYSLIRTTWLTKVFVLGDFLSFQAQSGGMISVLTFHSFAHFTPFCRA